MLEGLRSGCQHLDVLLQLLPRQELILQLRIDGRSQHALGLLLLDADLFSRLRLLLFHSSFAVHEGNVELGQRRGDACEAVLLLQT